MKKSLLFAAVIAITISYIQPAHATVRTVCSYPMDIAQYDTLQTAINASTTGDTILVQGSTVSYGTSTIQDKKLTIIGPGWSPLRQNPALKAMVDLIIINGAASSGTELQGLYFTGGCCGSVIGLQIEANIPIVNIRLIRNYFDNNDLWFGVTPGSPSGNNTLYTGYIIEGNYFYLSQIEFETGNRFEDALIQNNVFAGSPIYNFYLCKNVVINHNLFYGSPLFNQFAYCQGLTIQNNIFSKAEPGGTNVTANCIFKNNITFNTSASAPWTLNGNTEMGGNILNQDPQMADQSAINSGTNNALLNFTISGGPANNSATDGKDMGLLYDAAPGRYNWDIGRMPRNPYVYSVNIANNTIEPNTTLNVSIEARKNN